MNVIYHTYHFIIVFFLIWRVVYYILMLQKSIHFNVTSLKNQKKIKTYIIAPIR